MNAGVILTDAEEKNSEIVFLGETTTCFSVSTNQELVDLIEGWEPAVVAFDVGMEQPQQEFTQQEEELKEEGHAFVPNSHQPKRSRRLEALKAQLFEAMGASGPEIIRFEPHITAEALAIEGDSGLESYGIDTENIESSTQFDAMLGAVTARFYEQNQVEDMGVIIPEPLENQNT